ncbi:MAG: adaptor protein MecA [Clostridia bacterium]|nr:adaptor protein MecA [Clostridia bacterium]
MKIEKLTENKIRVIINTDELGENHINLHNIMTKAIETQDFFSLMLKKAEKEVDFHTEGCKLLIEAFSSLEDVLVFTITKYLPDSETRKKKLVVKRKSFDKTSKLAVCQFENFEVFCEFCNSIKSLHKIEIAKLAKNTALYSWKDSYYLVLRNINTTYPSINLFYSTISEFGKLLSYSEHFEFKLLEHGKVLIKKNAIDVGISFFAK